MKKEEINSPLVEVFSGSLWEADLIKGRLEANQIPSMLKDETINVFASAYNEMGGVIKVLVDEADKETALKIISEREEKEDN